ncbi:MAG: hypothetical protein ACREQ5_18550, partial [Candidatus Dormibacteria bacterium]
PLEPADFSRGETAALAAQRMGIGRDGVRRAARLRAADPDLADQVRAGLLSLAEAEVEARPEPEPMESDPPADPVVVAVRRDRRQLHPLVYVVREAKHHMESVIETDADVDPEDCEAIRGYLSAMQEMWEQYRHRGWSAEPG